MLTRELFGPCPCYDDITRVWGFQTWIKTDSARRMMLLEHFYQPPEEDARLGGGWVERFLKRFPALIPVRMTDLDPYLHHALNEHGALIAPTPPTEVGVFRHAA